MSHAEAHALIANNIRTHGQHLYLVTGKASPRYAYTIGLTESLGTELVLAGAIIFTAAQTQQILNALAQRLRDGAPIERTFELERLGQFTLRRAHSDWVDALMFGAADYYGVPIAGLQVLPDRDHWTTDIPDMSRSHTDGALGSWRWRFETWTYPVPEGSLAMTNLAALKGGRITYAARWEADQWELFSGPLDQISPEDARAVPLATLIGVDPTLEAVATLAVGNVISRTDGDEAWHALGDT